MVTVQCPSAFCQFCLTVIESSLFYKCLQELQFSKEQNETLSVGSPILWQSEKVIFRWKCPIFGSEMWENRVKKTFFPICLLIIRIFPLLPSNLKKSAENLKKLYFWINFQKSKMKLCQLVALFSGNPKK